MAAEVQPLERGTKYIWPCDDEPDGFQFQVLQSEDGDFYLSVVPKQSHLNGDLYAACYNASIRVRMPMIGGGSHEHLWHALAKAIQGERKDLGLPC
jgi:hypothetical protein